MGLFKAKDIKKYKYAVKTFNVTAGGKTEKLNPRDVSGIEIVNDYIGNSFPIFKVNISVSKKTYANIMKHKNEAEIKMTIQKFYKLDYGSKKKKKKSPRKTCLDGTFVLIMDDMGYYISEDLDKKNDKVTKKRRKKGATDLTTANGDNESTMELYLYRKEVATAIKKQVNIVFKQTNLISAVAYLLGEAGITNCLCSPFENMTMISQLFIPSMTIQKAIQYLDIMYGFYSRGSVIYYGLKHSYILNFKGGCTCFPSGEKQEVSFLVPKKTSMEGSSSGSIEKSGNKYYIAWEYDQMVFSNESITSDVINGTNAAIINPNDTSIETTDSNAITIGSNNIRTIENTTMNPYLGTTYAAQTSAASNVISGSIVDCDIEAFEPYRMFNFIFEDSKLVNKYNGQYFLSECSFKFANAEGNGEFNLEVGLTLRKMGDVSSSKTAMA